MRITCIAPDASTWIVDADTSSATLYQQRVVGQHANRGKQALAQNIGKVAEDAVGFYATARQAIHAYVRLADDRSPETQALVTRLDTITQSMHTSMAALPKRLRCGSGLVLNETWFIAPDGACAPLIQRGRIGESTVKRGRAAAPDRIGQERLIPFGCFGIVAQAVDRWVDLSSVESGDTIAMERYIQIIEGYAAQVTAIVGQSHGMGVPMSAPATEAMAACPAGCASEA